MLKSIDPLLSGDLLKVLADMGHGEVIAVVDRNYPSYRYDVPVIRLDGVDASPAIAAVLSVMPLDTFVPSPITRMEIDDHPESLNEVHAEVVTVASNAEGRAAQVAGVPRSTFYELTKGVAAIVHTGETFGYSCFLLRKGVV
jgi:L-fucose mutarotase